MQAEKLDIYLPYGINYERAKKNFEAAKRNERLRQLLEDVTPGIKQVKKLDIFGFLILPIQRVPRYSLLLSVIFFFFLLFLFVFSTFFFFFFVSLIQDLLKRTWKDHPDYHFIAEAVLKMQKASLLLNETRKKDEEKRKTQNLIGKFKEPTAIQELLDRSSNTACIKEGPVISNHTTATEDDPRKYLKAQLFLFSDQLVLAKKSVDKKKYAFLFFLFSFSSCHQTHPINPNNNKTNRTGKTFKIWNTVKFSDAFSIPLQSVTEDVTSLSGTEAHRKLLFLFLFSHHPFVVSV